MTGLRTLLVIVAICATIIGVQSPAAAESFTCPDGFKVEVSVTPNEFTVGAVCAGHMDPGGGETPPPPSETPAPAGTWVFDGYVCANKGICADHEMCPDGTIKRTYYFLSPEGVRGETRTTCPGDPDDPGPTIVPPTPGEILSALKKVVPTEAALSVQPPGGQTLVNFETIFSTVAEPFSTGKLELTKGFTVRFDVRPTAFTWKFGDGAELATDWSGEPWVPGKDVSRLINHVYTSTEPVKASVTVTWGADVRLNGGAPSPVDGTVDVTSPAVPLEILEARPTLVR